MALPVITDVARVAFVLTCTEPPTPVVNVLHVRRETGVDWATRLTAISDQLEDAGSAEMFKCVASSWLLSEVHLTPLDGSSVTQISLREAKSWPDGLASGDAIPAGAGILKLATAKRGRSYRGPLFLGPTSEGVQANGVLNSTVASDTGAAWRSFFDGLLALGSSITPVVASFLHRTA